jgi:hypothetical protein
MVEGLRSKSKVQSLRFSFGSQKSEVGGRRSVRLRGLEEGHRFKKWVRYGSLALHNGGLGLWFFAWPPLARDWWR